MTEQNGRYALVLVLAIVIPAGALLGAYGSQYLMGLHPCHLCLEQRWPHFAAFAAALLAIFMDTHRRAARILIAIAAGGIATSGAIGFFHAGVEADIWEYVSPCTSGVMKTGNALDAIMAMPMVRCDEAAFRLLGISMAGWNAIVSLSSSILIAVLLFRAGKRRIIVHNADIRMERA